MKLIDEIKKLRDECIEDEEFYRDVTPWLENSPWNQTNKKIIQEIIRIRRKLDKIISKYEPEPVKHAHVVWTESNTSHKTQCCSNCHRTFISRPDEAIEFCPHCGAKMEG